MIPYRAKEDSVKASTVSEAQIAFVLKQAEDGTPGGEVCREASTSNATFCNWLKKYADLMQSEMKRLRLFEEQNAKLKPARKRVLVDTIKADWKVSVCCTCSVIKIDWLRFMPRIQEQTIRAMYRNTWPFSFCSM